MRNLPFPVRLKLSDSTSELIYETETLTELENEFMVTRGKGHGESYRLGV